MGTVRAPACGNIFIASFESKFIYPYTKEKGNVFTVQWWPLHEMEWHRKGAIEIY